MILVRSAVLRPFAFQLAQAITIATRYSIVREEGALAGATSLLPERHRPSTTEPSTVVFSTICHTHLPSFLPRRHAMKFITTFFNGKTVLLGPITPPWRRRKHIPPVSQQTAWRVLEGCVVDTASPPVRIFPRWYPRSSQRPHSKGRTM